MGVHVAARVVFMLLSLEGECECDSACDSEEGGTGTSSMSVLLCATTAVSVVLTLVLLVRGPVRGPLPVRAVVVSYRLLLGTLTAVY